MPSRSELTPAIRERICELHSAAKWGYKRIHRRYPNVSLSTIRYTIKKEHERHDGVSKPRSGRPKKPKDANKVKDADKVQDADQVQDADKVKDAERAQDTDKVQDCDKVHDANKLGATTEIDICRTQICVMVFTGWWSFKHGLVISRSLTYRHLRTFSCRQRDIERKGLVVVLYIEMEGVKQMKANPSIDAWCVFIKPPSFEALEARLRGRGTEKEEDIQRRLARAKVEFEYANSQTNDKIIVNDNVKTAYRELDNFVFGPA
ncbi:Guanylate kinase/L-type calcium channel [Penicillium griseofulvum]|uniref:Guanylate kinase/L-type calcium channel n=1 Tax=Penicillium patulum TaxID=5078 RepID=A0A135LST1_PENPA|nr:Guanylate kinase/L-type calcium channel [Penicillium griseofulvum]KXG52020.1 Guanylate kinase/L-type calcium channel [Penicillium griseofulvum]